MNNNKTMKYNKTQEINYKNNQFFLFGNSLRPKMWVSLIKEDACVHGAECIYPGIKMLTSQMHYSCLTAEPENKRRPRRQRELGSNLLSLFPPRGAEWRTKRMHAHVNSPSASARKLGKKVRKIVEKLVGIWVGVGVGKSKRHEPATWQWKMRKKWKECGRKGGA